NFMGKKGIVTGSSGGLGAVIAKTLEKKGHNVVVNYFKSKEAAEKLVAEIGEEKAIAIQANVTNRTEVDALMKQATEHFGQVDVVVNNALVNFKFDPTTQKPFAELA